MFSKSRQICTIYRLLLVSLVVVGATAFSATTALANPKAISISSSVNNSCAAIDNGHVYCWGNNGSGQLGNGNTRFSSTPSDVTGLTDAVSVSIGHAFACALRSNGKISCWGSNVAGALGNGSNVSSSTPVEVSGISTAIAISAGDFHVCALVASGNVYCWGSNAYLALATEAVPSSNVPLQVSGVSNVKTIGSGASFSCALSVSGVVKCWGNNIYGKLGHYTSNVPSATPGAVEGVGTASELFVGAEWACIRTTADDLTCWSNVVPGVPNGPAPPGPPWTIPLAKGAKSVSGDLGNMCVVLATGGVQCWGTVGEGALGNGEVDTNLGKSWDQTAPIGGLPPASAVSTSNGHSCAIVADGQIACWGSNGWGQLGIGEAQYSFSPSSPIGVADVTALATSGVRTCALLSSSSIKCWGGVLSPSSDAIERTPFAYDSGYPADAISGGSAGICTAAASVRCSGDLSNSGGPQDIAGTTGASDVAVGNSHACALFSGDVSCWGDDYASQLGDDSVQNAIDVSAGNGFSCAVISGGTVKCWGKHPYLGDGDTGSSSTAAPVSVTGISTATHISGGNGSTCAILTGGTVSCWGDGSDGRLGNGTTDTFASTPVTVSGLSDAESISVGSLHTCAVRATGNIVCWGSNGSGELGDGTSLSSSTPVQVSGISNAQSVVTGYDHTCALLETGTVTCWGSGSSGQTGIPYEGYRVRPALIAGFGDPYVAPVPPRPNARPVIRLSKAKLTKSVSFEVTCFVACAVKATLKLGKSNYKLGSKKYGGLRTYRVKFKLSKKTAKAVKSARKKRKKITLKVTVTNSTGESRSSSRRLK